MSHEIDFNEDNEKTPSMANKDRDNGEVVPEFIKSR